MANGAMGSGSLVGTKAGLASTYSNVFMIGNVIILAGMVIFIFLVKMKPTAAPVWLPTKADLLNL